MSEDAMSIDHQTPSKSENLQTLTLGPLSSSLSSLSASAHSIPSNKDFHFYYNFDDFKLPIQQIAHKSQSLLDSIGSSNPIFDDTLLFPGDVDADESYDWLVNMNDEILERLQVSLDEFQSVRKMEEETGMGSENGFQLVYGKKKKGLVNSGNGCSSGDTILDSRVKVDMKAKRVKAKVSFHIPTIKKPQEEYSILVNNSNRPFEHVWLQRNEDGSQFIHPLEKLSVLDFVDKSTGDTESITPPPLERTPFKLVEEVKDLKELAAKLRGVHEFAVDLEHNQYRSFQGLTCLMQISTRTEDFIIDTLKLRVHVGPYLREVFKDPAKKKVMHGADRDIIWLQRDFGIYVCNLFDTGQASRVMKMERNSLEYLLQHFCGITANKEYQNADWRLRPLPEEMVRYGREDTHYLLYIYDMMKAMLFSMPKNDESSDSPLVEVYKRSYDVCMQLYEKELLTETSYMHIYGLQNAGLTAQQLAIVAGLFEWRDVVARQEDESTGYILPNKTLLEIAKQMPVTPQKLHRVLKSKHPYVERNLDAIVNIIRHAMQNAAEFEAAAKILKEARMQTEKVEANDDCEDLDVSTTPETADIRNNAASNGNSSPLKEAFPQIKKETKFAKVGQGGFSKGRVESGSYASKFSKESLPFSPQNRNDIYPSATVTGATVQARKKPASAFGALLGGGTSKRTTFESTKKDKEEDKLESIRSSVKLPFQAFIGRNETPSVEELNYAPVDPYPTPVVPYPVESYTPPTATSGSLEEIILLSDDSDYEDLNNESDTKPPESPPLETKSESLSDLSTSFQKCFKSNNQNKSNENVKKPQESTGLVQLKPFDYAAAIFGKTRPEGKAAGDEDGGRKLANTGGRKMSSGVGQAQKDNGTSDFQPGKRRQAFPASGNRSTTYR
ncbi:Polynucleotidyl transferase ribonuclease H fold protein with HRDC domain [Euphorbia peplus]|nr:Polynucleotidyl transferase ribonuclease H fold protein with HRDC domain [Euphorbia peplus]